MTKKDIEFIKDKLSIIIGEPLQEFDRAGMGIFLTFGELVEVSSSIVKGSPTYELSGKYTLDIDTSARFYIGNNIILTKEDISLPNPTLANQQGLTFQNFEWHIRGNNYFDWAVQRHFSGRDFSGYIVKDIDVTKFGDLTIYFKNDFVLETFIDSVTSLENWSFGDIREHLSMVRIAGSRLDWDNMEKNHINNEEV